MTAAFRGFSDGFGFAVVAKHLCRNRKMKKKKYIKLVTLIIAKCDAIQCRSIERKEKQNIKNEPVEKLKCFHYQSSIQFKYRVVGENFVYFLF